MPFSVIGCFLRICVNVPVVEHKNKHKPITYIL